MTDSTAEHITNLTPEGFIHHDGIHPSAKLTPPTMTLTYRDHGTLEKLCPRCFDFRTGSVTEQVPPGVACWACDACGYTDEPENVPHDVGEYDAFVEQGIIDEDRL